jgi:hypothetical protein
VALPIQVASRFVPASPRRQHPELPAKLVSADTAWQAVVQRFRSDTQVRAYLKRVIHRNPATTQELLDDAAERIREAEPELIRPVPPQLRQRRLRPAQRLQRLVLLAVYVQALRTDRHGGRQVTMSREALQR